jgi:glycosyltransferase involved in cell wall biosynthesis
VDLGIRALAQICCETSAALTIVGTGSRKQRDALAELAAKLGIADRVRILPAAPQAELAAHLQASDVVLAPLTRNDRNLVQGCCPLKILEAMAASVPVISTDLPVVRELGCAGMHFLLAKAGSVDQITAAALRIHADRELAAHISQQARAQVESCYTWERAGDSLTRVYRELGISRANTD